LAWKRWEKHPHLQFSPKVGTIIEDSPVGLRSAGWRRRSQAQWLPGLLRREQYRRS